MTEPGTTLTQEEIDRARALLDRAKTVKHTSFASKSFMDRMTSASADPGAADETSPSEARPDDGTPLVKI